MYGVAECPTDRDDVRAGNGLLAPPQWHSQYWLCLRVLVKRPRPIPTQNYDGIHSSESETTRRQHLLVSK